MRFLVCALLVLTSACEGGYPHPWAREIDGGLPDGGPSGTPQCVWNANQTALTPQCPSGWMPACPAVEAPGQVYIGRSADGACGLVALDGTSTAFLVVCGGGTTCTTTESNGRHYAPACIQVLDGCVDSDGF